MKNLILVLVLISSSYAHSTFRGEKGVATDKDNSQECQSNQRALKIDVTCDEKYHLYGPKRDRKYSPSSKVRIGSYNIWRSYEQYHKRWDLVAEMIDSEWDVVALQELQPAMDKHLKANESLIDADVSDANFKKAYVKPSYIRMLQELQSKDSSWSLIVSPYTQGADQEILGFLFRTTKVKLERSKYCGGPACILNVSDFGKKSIIKVPFVARFVSGGFDFNYISIHTSFNGPFEVKGQCSSKDCVANRKKAVKTILSASVTDQMEYPKGSKTKYLQSLKYSGKGPSSLIARFYQVYEALQISTEISKKDKDKDVIIGGDFNLNPSEAAWADVLWKAILLTFDQKLLIEKRTSISKTGGKSPDGGRTGYANAYDHFLVNLKKGQTNECVDHGAKRIDIISEDEGIDLSSGFDLAGELEKHHDPDHFADIVEYVTSPFVNKSWVDADGEIHTSDELIEKSQDDPKNKTLRPLQFKVKNDSDCKHIKEYVHGSFVDIVTATTSIAFCKLEKGLDKKLPYRYFTEALSDHVPIGMTCSAK